MAKVNTLLTMVVGLQNILITKVLESRDRLNGSNNIIHQLRRRLVGIFCFNFFYNTLRKHDLEGLFKLFVFVQQVYEASHTDADQHEDVVDASNTVTNVVETD